MTDKYQTTKPSYRLTNTQSRGNGLLILRDKLLGRRATQDLGDRTFCITHSKTICDCNTEPEESKESCSPECNHCRCVDHTSCPCNDFVACTCDEQSTCDCESDPYY